MTDLQTAGAEGLLLCPFCGQAPEEVSCPGPEGWGVCVACNRGCGAMGPHFPTEPPRDAFEADRMAAEGWNRRASSEQTVVRLRLGTVNADVASVMAGEVGRLRAALEQAEKDMRYAAGEFLKARRMRQYHSMFASADEAHSVLVKVARD